MNPETGRSWEEYLDRDSWVKMYMLQDFLAQWDVESFSFFVYKEADDPLLYCGPVWDFDLSMGATGIGRIPNIMQRSHWLTDHREGWLTQLESQPAFSGALRSFAEEMFFPILNTYLNGENAGNASSTLSFREQMETLTVSAAMDCHRWKEKNTYRESAEALLRWLEGRRDFWQGDLEDPGAYCKVTFRYGFADMDVYIRRGEVIGFVPTEEYGEHLYGSFRRKYGEIGGWTDEEGNVLTADTVISRDQVFTPFEPESE